MAPTRLVDGSDPSLYREFTISFPGGSITSTKDVLQHIFADPSKLDVCNPETKAVIRREHKRTAYPGGPQTTVRETPYIKKNYSNGGTSRAAGGEPIRVLINGDYWTARLNGSHQAFMDYLCSNREALAPGFNYWKSQAGKPYAMSSASTGD